MELSTRSMLMKSIHLMVAAGFLISGSAWAQQPATANAAPEPREGQAAALPAETPLDDYRCLRHTGSLITASRNQRERSRPSKIDGKPSCAPVAGRAWSRKDLERTGANNLLDALRMLDPAVH